jgi:hypothetical protein
MDGITPQISETRWVLKKFEISISKSISGYCIVCVMSTGNPIDDLIKSFDDVVKSADDFWKAVVRNYRDSAVLVGDVIISSASAIARQQWRLWLQSEYFRSLREQTS